MVKYLEQYNQLISLEFIRSVLTYISVSLDPKNDPIVSKALEILNKKDMDNYEDNDDDENSD